MRNGVVDDGFGLRVTAHPLIPLQVSLEWLETDGLGGFASGTVGGIRTRRYHALLLAATRPPAGRMVLVNGFDAWVEAPQGTVAITSQRYTPDVVHPEGSGALSRFEKDPWPTWTFALEDGTEILQELFVPRGLPAVALSWRLAKPAAGEGRAHLMLCVRPFFSGREDHALHHENSSFAFAPLRDGGVLRWRPYDGVPSVAAASSGEYAHDPHWYRNFLYLAERERGLDCVEDLASPGVFRFELGEREAVLVLAAEAVSGDVLPPGDSASRRIEDLRASERARRASFPSPLHRAAADYVVRRGTGGSPGGKTIVAGYPWFLDWGRDTFVALRGLCIATGRLDDARDILLEWAGRVSVGMLPNRFPEGGEKGEFNSVDASLWYVVAVHDYLRAASAAGHRVSVRDRRALQQAVREIVAGHISGTRYGIRADSDGLLAAGAPGVQLTWMDAKVGDSVVTQRSGKPVEVQALWLNALAIASSLDRDLAPLLERGLHSFEERFWDERSGHLLDVVDVDHERGRDDASLRPNQVFAVGGLPMAILEGSRAERVVRVLEEKLWTPMGLRSLSSDDPRYAPRYEGEPAARDAAYHQGTAWPWLLGPFVEAWVRVHGGTDEAKATARERFVAPLLRHLDEAGLGHVSEVADGHAPFTPRGCPFQAWSLGELLRLLHSVLPASASRGVAVAADAATEDALPRGLRR